MSMRKLLISGPEFQWLGNRDYYFSYEEAQNSLPLFKSLVLIFFVPLLLNSVVKFLHDNSLIKSPRFYRYYSTVVRWWDVRLPHTGLSVLDVSICFIWVLVNVCFVDPKDFPGQIGHLVVANTAIVLIPAYRNSIFVMLFQVPFERTVKYHRWLGRGLFALITVHLIGYWVKWFQAGIFVSQLLVLPNLFAHLSWLSGLILTLTSLNVIRRNWFEVFFYAHFAYIFFFIFAILHFPTLLPFVIPGFIMFFFDRVVRIMRAHPKNDYVSIQSDGGITRIKGRRLGILNYECGQYCFINIPAVSKLQWHPISFTSSPNDPYFQFTIKTLGSWSKALTSLNGKNDVMVKIDGPYGQLTYDVLNYDVIVMCAGGIGITPMLSVLRDLHYKMQVGMIQPMKVYLFWTMRDPSLYYSFGDCFDDILNSSVSKYFNLSVWITQPGGSSPMFIRGRPDWEDIFKTLSQTHSDVDRIGVLACGPAGLVNSTWDCCNRLSTGKTAFDFHQETFEF